jgi:hypothetical protein
MINIKRNWPLYNKRLVDRGRPSTYLRRALKNRYRDLKILNKGKVGRPYQYSNVEILAAFALKCYRKTGYRQAAGEVYDFENARGIKNTPDFKQYIGVL